MRNPIPPPRQQQNSDDKLLEMVNDDTVSLWAGSTCSDMSVMSAASNQSKNSSQQPTVSKQERLQRLQEQRAVAYNRPPPHRATRHVVLPYLKGDWTGMHRRQQLLKPWSSQNPPIWAVLESHNVNLYNASINDTVWLHEKPAWVPGDEFAANRSIEKRRSYVTGFDDYKYYITEAGDYFSYTDYLMYLCNVNKPITIVECGTLKSRGGNFDDLLQQTRDECSDYITYFFPRLGNRLIPFTRENSIKMEMLWIHGVDSLTLNDYAVKHNLFYSDIQSLRGLQPFMARAAATHNEIIRLLQVCSSFILLISVLCVFAVFYFGHSDI